MVKAVIFDYDGTLSNRQDMAYNLFKDYFRFYFKDLDEMEYEAVLQDMMIYDCNGTINLKYRMAPFINKYNKYFKEEDFQEFYDYYCSNMYKYAHLKKDTLDVLEQLKGKYKIAILSNGDSIQQHSKIDANDLPKHFDEVLVTGDIGIHKPDKRVFEILADRLNVKCEECVFIGDVFSSDIIGAIRANMIPVWIVPDYERPTSYKGFRILKITELLDVLKQLEIK